MALAKQHRILNNIVDVLVQTQHLFQQIANLSAFAEVKEIMPFFLVAYAQALQAKDFRMPLFRRLGELHVMEHCCCAAQVLQKVNRIEEEDALGNRNESLLRERQQPYDALGLCRFGASCKWPERCRYDHPETLEIDRDGSDEVHAATEAHK